MPAPTVPNHKAVGLLLKTRISVTETTSMAKVGIKSIAGVKKAASGTVVKRPSVNAPQNSELSTAASVLSMPACSVA